MVQEIIVHLIVVIAAGFLIRSGYQKYGKRALASYLLKRGKVRMAMKVRGEAKAAKDCGKDCGCD